MTGEAGPRAGFEDVPLEANQMPMISKSYEGTTKGYEGTMSPSPIKVEKTKGKNKKMKFLALGAVFLMGVGLAVAGMMVFGGVSKDAPDASQSKYLGDVVSSNSNGVPAPPEPQLDSGENKTEDLVRDDPVIQNPNTDTVTPDYIDPMMTIELIEVGVEVIDEGVDVADVDPCEEEAEPVRALLVDNLSKRRAAEHDEHSPSYGNLRSGETHIQGPLRKLKRNSDNKGKQVSSDFKMLRILPPSMSTEETNATDSVSLFKCFS